MTLDLKAALTLMALGISVGTYIAVTETRLATLERERPALTELWRQVAGHDEALRGR